MSSPRSKTPLRDLRTFGKGRAVRLENYDYAGDDVIHLILCVNDGSPFQQTSLAAKTCESVDFYCHRLEYRLFGYCLMPDHLHVLLSPHKSGVAICRWLQAFKSFTSHYFSKNAGKGPLWQKSAYDHVCREHETAETVMRYIADNPVKAGLVDDWRKWPWTRVYT